MDEINNDYKIAFRAVISELRKNGYNVTYGILPKGDAIYRIDENNFIADIAMVPTRQKKAS